MPSPYTFGMGGNSMQQPKKAAPANPTLAYAGQRPPAALPADWMQQAASVTDPRAWHTLKAQINRAGQYSSGGQQALYSNPLAGQFDTETAGPRHGLFGRIKQAARTTPAFSQQGRLAMAQIAAFVLGAQALGTATAGAGAGASSGGGLVSGTGAGGTLGGGGGLSANFAALAGGSGGGGMAGFGNTALINAGLNLAGGYLQDRATKKANQSNIDAMKDRIKQALQQLSPEQIQELMRQFLPQIAAVNNPLQQTALQGLATSQARQGLAGTPYGLTAEAGLRGQFANNMSTQAFQQAMGLAGQRASAVTGAPFVQTQPNLGLANAFSNTADQTLLAYALSRRNQPPVTPYTMNQGGPAPWEIQQTEGTPYRWPFNPGRY